MLLATTDLVLLGILLWPWREAAFIPGNENPAFDLMVILPVFTVFIWLLSRSRKGAFNLALVEGIYFGPLSGVLLVAQIVLRRQVGDDRLEWLSYCLWAGAGLLWAIAGGRGARASKHSGMGLFAGMWSGLSGCLIASTFALACMIPGVANAESSEAPKQAETATSGDSPTTLVLESLLPVEQILLIGVNAGAALGLVSGMLATRKLD
jgi:hypothetical protein